MVAARREMLLAVQRPTEMLLAWNLETGAEARILTAPLDVEANPQFLELAEGWLFYASLRKGKGRLVPDPDGRLRTAAFRSSE